MNTDTHVEIKVKGKPVRTYNYNNNNYIEARAGTEYTIRVCNDSWSRMLAVITVDGLNVISGQAQDESVGEGYIVPFRNSIEIKGFRKDTDTVGAFKFCKKGASYCNEKGLKGNNGVIGVRLYREKKREPVYYKMATFNEPDPGYKCSVDNSSTAAKPYDFGTTLRSCGNTTDSYCYTSSVKSAPDFDLGTTWGQKINDSVKTVEFENETYYCADHRIYYDTRENLEKTGIVFWEEKLAVLPKAFGAYATPPKGWKGK